MPFRTVYVHNGRTYDLRMTKEKMDIMRDLNRITNIMWLRITNELDLAMITRDYDQDTLLPDLANHNLEMCFCWWLEKWGVVWRPMLTQSELGMEAETDEETEYPSDEDDIDNDNHPIWTQMDAALRAIGH